MMVLELSTDDLESRLTKLKPGALRHELMAELAVRRMREYGHWDVLRNQIYANDEGQVLGEIDMLVLTDDSLRLYEFKSSDKGLRHGQNQLDRAEKWYEDNNFLGRRVIHKNLVQYEDKHWVVTRCH